LRIIVDREKEIKRFNPKEYWQIAVDLKKEGYDDLLEASLEKINNEKFELCVQSETEDIVEQIKKENFLVTNVSKREVKRKPSPPLITSTMQQEAFNKIRFNANKTMMIAQQLYEGIEVGDGEAIGLITYMRTDSVNISNEAMEKLRSYIQNSFGDKYLPQTPNKYKSKKSAQEAHEAIRVSDVQRTPDSVRKYLDDDQLKLYTIIWNRFVSSQMTQARYQYKKIEISAGKFLFGTNGSTLLFDGYLRLELEEKEEEKLVDITHYKKDDALILKEVKATQHFTKPPPRYSDASLVKALEEDGIGRPSTYASIILTLVLRNYIIRDRGYLSPTELGILICELLVEYFSRLMDVSFTAKMEASLDLIEEGKLGYQKLLKEFYKPFHEELEYAEKTIEKTENFIDKNCPECDRQMVIKWGRRGKFLSCSGFPECKHAEAFTTGVKCPEEGCEGELVARKSRRGSFYGCTNYPKCTYVNKDLPSEADESK